MPLRNKLSLTPFLLLSSAFILTLNAPFSAVAQLGDLTKQLGGGTTSLLPDSKIASGLKDALKVGTDKTVDLTGRPGGYLDNPAIKIGLPGNVKALDGAMRAAGMGPKLDAFEASMNHAAEAAAPAAKQIFVNAILAMSFEDARKLLNGGDTSITTYFKEKTTGDLKTAFRPAVEGAMEKDGVTAQYDALMSKAPSIPFMKTQSLNINDYVISKALDGLFYILGQQEKEIRTNPMARTTPLLKEVFANH
jgi:Protein of unknown function (DUF4197)